jgi:Flp pilus assembly protein protease CpaA
MCSEDVRRMIISSRLLTALLFDQIVARPMNSAGKRCLTSHMFSFDRYVICSSVATFVSRVLQPLSQMQTNGFDRSRIAFACV